MPFGCDGRCAFTLSNDISSLPLRRNKGSNCDASKTHSEYTSILLRTTIAVYVKTIYVPFYINILTVQNIIENLCISYVT